MKIHCRVFWVSERKKKDDSERLDAPFGDFSRNAQKDFHWTWTTVNSLSYVDRKSLKQKSRKWIMKDRRIV
jgi:hypothetical protein